MDSYDKALNFKTTSIHTNPEHQSLDDPIIYPSEILLAIKKVDDWVTKNSPLPDSDDDGFPNIYDKCPTEKGILEKDGCPKEQAFLEKY